MVSINMLPYLTATATILDNESHSYRQQCNLRTVMMCENNRFESQQIQIGENKTCHNKVAKVHNIAHVMLQHKFFEIIETYTQIF